MSGNPSVPAETRQLTLLPLVDDASVTTAPEHHLPVDGSRQPPPAMRHLVDEARQFYRRIAFIVCVAVPVLVATIYFGFIASDLYVSETRFLVRQGGNPDAFSDSMGAVLQSSGIETTSEGSHAVKAFVESRDLVERLAKQNDLLGRLDRSEADFVTAFSTFWRPQTQESLYKWFSSFIDLSIDKSTGISTLKVKAFHAADAQALAVGILDHAEALVNRLNARVSADSIQFAEEVVQRYEARVGVIQEKLTEYRNRELVVDPGRQTSVALDLSTRLALELAQVDTKIAGLLQSNPRSPQLNDLRSRRAALKGEIDRQSRLVVGESSSLAGKLADYEKLVLEKELYFKALTAAMASLERARQEAVARRLYLERIVEPNIADRPEHPRRLLILMVVVAVCGGLYWIVRVMLDLTLEHLR
ncbi:hypothetical protein [Aquabacter spiritensis]|uniref:Capsular polysaccharide transport system permease protein n=1 Tax=Aquabacter spiritensis TaxID=933073 RepID=A0A4R3LVE1_9HYPH|nr:hypothetical protein [Aquabacter spiritensis]TCT04016.1 capsular polysaccharide transport system permease protein [Aquabacter spiritensis]